jgi:hypothetical protein
MYSSLDKIDILAKGDAGEALVVQTDHRQRDEIEAEPELSVLFALTRLINPRQTIQARGETLGDIVYVAFDEPPAFLRDAIAAAGGCLERPPDKTRHKLPRPPESSETIADRAFIGLADRVCRRVGLTDPASALRALEAETTMDPPDREEDEIGYWTRVMELTALTAAALRRRYKVSCVITDHGVIPLGFSLGGNQILLPANRAERFIDDGASESMFLLLGSAEEVAARTSDTPEGPLLPSLRSKREALASQLLFRPLLERGGDDLPVIAYGNDGDKTFALLQRERHDVRADEIHHEALGNLPAQQVQVDALDVGKLRALTVSGSFFATEKLLDAAFMRGLEARLGSPLLAVGVPRRGLMFVTSAAQDPAAIQALMAIVEHEHDKGGSRAISRAIVLVGEGKPVGHAQVGGEPKGNGGGNGSDNDRRGEPPAKKPGFFKRLFGKKS